MSTAMTDRTQSLSKRLSSAVILSALALGIAATLRADLPTQRDTVHRSHGSWAYDVTNDTRLVGSASNVFFGTVVSMEPALPLVSDSDVEVTYPQTAYTVVPDGNVKGYLTVPVIVIQMGGIHTDGTTHLFDGDSLLAVGSSYLFVTRGVLGQPEEYVPASSASAQPIHEHEIYALIAPGHDHHLVTSTAGRHALQTRFGEAYANQVDPWSEMQ